MAAKPRVPADIEEALRAVVEYNWDAELEDAAENGVAGHIFGHLVTLDNWLNGTDYKAEELVEEISEDED